MKRAYLNDLGGAGEPKRAEPANGDMRRNRSNGSFHCSFESPMVLLCWLLGVLCVIFALLVRETNGGNNS